MSVGRYDAELLYTRNAELTYLLLRCKLCDSSLLRRFLHSIEVVMQEVAYAHKVILLVSEDQALGITI